MPYDGHDRSMTTTRVGLAGASGDCAVLVRFEEDTEDIRITADYWAERSGQSPRQPVTIDDHGHPQPSGVVRRRKFDYGLLGTSVSANVGPISGDAVSLRSARERAAAVFAVGGCSLIAALGPMESGFRRTKERGRLGSGINLDIAKSFRLSGVA
jgi:hypothetical protein